MEPVEVIQDRLLAKGGDLSVAVVALDGFSAAGKSSLASALSERLDAAIIHGDDFYRDMPESERLRLSPAAGVEAYFDWQRMRSEAVEPLRHGGSATFQRFDWEAGGGLTAAITIHPRPVVVVEGVYAGRPELGPLVDLAVFVDTPEDERRRRRRLRHDALDWELRWDAAEELYFSLIRPVASFDLVVPGLG